MRTQTLEDVVRTDVLTCLRARRLQPQSHAGISAAQTALLPAAAVLPDFFAERSKVVAAAVSTVKACPGVAGALTAEGCAAVDLAGFTAALLTKCPIGGGVPELPEQLVASVVLVSSALLSMPGNACVWSRVAARRVLSTARKHSHIMMIEPCIRVQDMLQDIVHRSRFELVDSSLALATCES